MSKRFSVYSVILMACILLPASGCRTIGARPVSKVKDSFPKEILNYTTFTRVKQNQDTSKWLGRVLVINGEEQEEKMVAWTAREILDNEADSYYEVEFTGKEYGGFNLSFPELHLNANASIGSDIIFKLEFYNLKEYKLIGPVMLDTMRDDELAQGTFIQSLLYADTIAMKVGSGSHGDFKADFELMKKLTAGTNAGWDNKLKAIKLGENAFIGFKLKKPTEADLKRQL